MKSEGRLRLGIWQDSGVTGDIDANVQIIRQAVSEAADQGVDILVFPECFLTGYYNPGNPLALAKSITEAHEKIICDIARDFKTAFVIGRYEVKGNHLYNAAQFIGPEGETLASYHKRALYGEWEQRVFTPGSDNVIIDYAGFRIGLLICYDVEFPELVRDLAKAQVDLILNPTALMAPYQVTADQMVPVRAMENQIFIAYANRIGSEKGLNYVGRSVIVGPQGNELVRGTFSDRGLLIADVNKTEIEQSRADFSYLASLTDLNL